MKGTFSFEKYWTQYEGSKDTVRKVWRAKTSHNAGDIAINLDKCGKALKIWSKKEIGTIAYKVREKEQQLNNLIENIDNFHDFAAITNCKKDLIELSIQEEVH